MYNITTPAGKQSHIHQRDGVSAATLLKGEFAEGKSNFLQMKPD
jgi:hypothetical protein